MFGLNSYMLIGIAVIMGMMGIYFVYSQHEMKVMAATIATQAEALNAQQIVINQLKSDQKAIEADTQNLSDIMNAQSTQADKLDQSLQQLADLSPNTAKLIETLINQSSVARMRCMALATGASPTKDEKNSICPQLLPQPKKFLTKAPVKRKLK